MKTVANNTYPKVAVQWLNKALIFIISILTEVSGQKFRKYKLIKFLETKLF